MVRNNIEQVSHKPFLVLVGNLKVGKPILCCFFFQIPTQIPSQEAFAITYVC